MNVLSEILNKVEIQIQTRWQAMEQRKHGQCINYPYISGDVIASFCDTRIDGFSIDLQELEAAQTVFVKGDFLEYHLQVNSKLLSNKVVVSGNSDRNFDFPPIAL